MQHLNNPDEIHSMWVFSGGSILVLLQSIISGAKRNWIALMLGCILGGGGSYLAGMIFSDSKYVYIICGVAAVITENMLMGFVNMSKEFADSPIKVFSHFVKMMWPTFGKGGAPGNTDVEDGLK